MSDTFLRRSKILVLHLAYYYDVQYCVCRKSAVLPDHLFLIDELVIIYFGGRYLSGVLPQIADDRKRLEHILSPRTCLE